MSSHDDTTVHDLDESYLHVHSLSLIKTNNIENYFFSTNSEVLIPGLISDLSINRQILDQELSSGSLDGKWPPVRVRHALRPIYQIADVRVSSVPDIGMGLFACKDYLENEVVGVYGGTFTSVKAANNYSLELSDPASTRYNLRKTGNLIHGTPSGDNDFTVFGRINFFFF
jgi:hypothetical protein